MSGDVNPPTMIVNYQREVEVADGIPDPGAGLPDPFEYFEKVILCTFVLAVIILFHGRRI